MFEERRDVVVDVVDHEARAEGIVLALARRRAAAGLTDLGPGRAAAGRTRASASAQRPLGGWMFLDLRLVGGEEVGDDLDREDPDGRAAGIDHRRVVGLATAAGRPARRAARRRGRGAGRARSRAVAGPSRRRGRARESQPSGLALAVDEQRVWDLGPVELRPDLAGRLAGERQRRLPEVDVARPASARGASAPGRRRRSPRRSRRPGAIRSSAGVAYWASMPAFAGPRSDRPS